MENEKTEVIHFRCSKKMKEKLTELGKKSKLGTGPIMVISVYRLFEEMEMLDDSLKDINKGLPDFCDIVYKRYANYAFSSLKSLMEKMSHEDRLEIHLAIQKNIQKHNKTKKEEFDYLSSLKF